MLPLVVRRIPCSIARANMHMHVNIGLMSSIIDSSPSSVTGAQLWSSNLHDDYNMITSMSRITDGTTQLYSLSLTASGTTNDFSVNIPSTKPISAIVDMSILSMPSITSVSSLYISTTGNTVITLTGSGFFYKPVDAITCRYSQSSSSSLQLVTAMIQSSTLVTCTTPPLSTSLPVMMNITLFGNWLNLYTTTLQIDPCLSCPSAHATCNSVTKVCLDMV
jgi:hypothetical protein